MTAVPKPAARLRRPNRTISQRRATQARAALQQARKVKALVKKLDGHRCRWPGCDVCGLTVWGRLEAAHYKAAGMGGDPTSQRMTPENLITLCAWHHRGPKGLHSGLAHMQPLTERGMRGPVRFWMGRTTDYAEPFSTVGITEPAQLTGAAV